MLTLKHISNAWDDFFFKPRPVEGIALFRIILMTLIFSYFLTDIYNARDFYGPEALISLKTVKSQFLYPHLNIFHIFGTSLETVYWFLGIYGVAIICALVGYHTRWALIVTLIFMVSFHQRNIWLLSSAECLMRIIMILLICSPCGHALSVDSLLGRKYPKFYQEKEWAPWALRLIQIQLSVVYVWTAWHKLKGHDWYEGTAIYYATRLEDMKNFSVPFLLDSVAFIKFSTWGTLALEFSLGILIWIKELRRPLILTGVIFHLGIEYTMSIPFFELIMISLLILYYTPEELKIFVDKAIRFFNEQIERSYYLSSWKEKLVTEFSLPGK